MPVSLAALALAACASAATSASPPNEGLAGDYLSGRFAAGERSLGEAADRYRRAAARTGEEEVVARAFEYALAAGDVEEAADLARELASAPAEAGAGRLAAFQDGDLPRLTLAAVAVEDRDWSEALSILEGPFDSSLGRSIAYMLGGWATFGDAGVDAATDHLASPPEGVFAGFAPYHAALMFDIAGRTDEARAAYATALRTPAAEEAGIGFAMLQEREGATEDAQALYRRMSEQRGLSGRAGRLGLARIGEPLAGESDAFVRTARNAPRRLAADAREGAAVALTDFAWAAFEQASAERMAALRAGFGEVDLQLNAPLGFARLATFIDPDQDAARYLVGAIAATYDQLDLAATAYGEVSPSSLYYAFAAMDRAEALIALGREDDAIRQLEAYLERDALSPDVWLSLSRLHAIEARWDAAIEAASGGIEAAGALAAQDEAAPNGLWRYYFARGATAIEAGRWAMGEADMRRALELSPDEPDVLNYLGYSYIERGERLDEAFGMIEEALRQQPNSGAITDSLGWAHYQRGDYAQAVRYLEDAVQLEPGDDVITDHLGDAYWQAGRRQEARYEWRRVLEIEDLDPELRAAVEAKLAGEAPVPGALADDSDA